MSERGRHAVAADVVFDGSRTHDSAAVVLDGPAIIAVVSRHEVPPALLSYVAPPGAWLAPGFIDVQVNGGGDTLFNDHLSPAAIATIASAHRRFGTTGFLPTLITDTDERMRQALAAVAASLEREPAVLGIHFEGPFLSRLKPGIHSSGLIRRPEPHHAELLTSLRRGVTLVTLAPEEVPRGFIAELVAAGVSVSLGHSMATYEETRVAIAEGITGFTHLFNAMRALDSREPGPIAAALEATDRWFSLIVGWHSCRSRDAAARVAGGRAADPRHRRDAAGGRAISASFRSSGRAITLRDGRLTARTAGSRAPPWTWRAQCATACGFSMCRSRRRSAGLPSSRPRFSACIRWGACRPGAVPTWWRSTRTR